jgi:hypothetical protein
MKTLFFITACMFYYKQFDLSGNIYTIILEISFWCFSIVFAACWELVELDMFINSNTHYVDKRFRRRGK